MKSAQNQIKLNEITKRRLRRDKHKIRAEKLVGEKFCLDEVFICTPYNYEDSTPNQNSDDEVLHILEKKVSVMNVDSELSIRLHRSTARNGRA